MTLLLRNLNLTIDDSPERIRRALERTTIWIGDGGMKTFCSTAEFEYALTVKLPLTLTPDYRLQNLTFLPSTFYTT